MNGVEIRDSVADAVRDADAAVIVTAWAELQDLAKRESAMRCATADRRRAEHARSGRGPAGSFAYEGVGRPTSPLSGLPETSEPEHELA